MIHDSLLNQNWEVKIHFPNCKCWWIIKVNYIAININVAIDIEVDSHPLIHIKNLARLETGTRGLFPR